MSCTPATPHGRPPRGRDGFAAEALIGRYRQTGDVRCRARAIESAMPLASRIARRYRAGAEPLEDLQQVAYLGLVKAVDRFEPGRGTRFSSFAIPTIAGELRRHFRDRTWAVHVPRGTQEDMLKVRTMANELSGRLSRAPTVRELSDATGLGAEAVAEALQARAVREVASLDGPIGFGTDGEILLGDTIGSDDGAYALVEDRAAVGPLLRRLPRHDRQVLFMRFAEHQSQTQIAARIGRSQMHVSRLLRRTIAGLAEENRLAGSAR